MLVTAAAFESSWRYQLPALVLLPLGGALGITALIGPLRRPGPRSEAAALPRSGGHRHGAVLDAIPATSCGLPVDTLVIVDGCTDATVAMACRHGARVCQLPTNRGQGAALRLGYGLARRGGARYVVTTDGDGQYDMGELRCCGR